MYFRDEEGPHETDLQKLMSIAKIKKQKVVIDGDTVTVGLKKFKNIDGALGYLEGLGLDYR